MEKDLMELREAEMLEIEGGMMVSCFNPEIGWVGNVDGGEKNTNARLEPWP